MENIPSFTTGHCYKELVLTLDYLNIMNNECVVKGDRNNRLHPTLRIDFSNSDVCNLHQVTPPFDWALAVIYLNKFFYFFRFFAY